MVLREKTLKKNNRLAIIKSAENKTVLVKPNTNVAITAYVCQKIEYAPTAAIIEPSKEASIPSDLDITPTLVDYNITRKDTVVVHLSNITTRTVAIAPNTILAELHPVVVDQLQTATEEKETEDFLDSINIENSDLTEEEIQKVKHLIRKHQDLFSKSDTDIGHYRGVTHKINLSDETPFKQRYRRIPPAMIDEVRTHLEQLLATGIIRKSHSPYSSNIVLVRKKDGRIRMCVDYRMLNQRTVKDSYALPRIDDVLDTLSGARYFTALDMKSGYHQIELEEEHKERTAFTVGTLGFFEFQRLPFGLCNSPATYQRIMEECLGDLNMKICVIYLDDLIIFADTFEEHLRRLEIVFNRLRECGLKLATKKCVFFQQKVKYVGHIVSQDGIETDPDKVKKVRDWPTPTKPEEV